MPAESPSLLIVGTGAMACLFAGRFAAAGIPFKILGSWPEGIAALQRDGVRVLEQDGNQKAYPVQVSGRLCLLPGRPVRPGTGQILADRAGCQPSL